MTDHPTRPLRAAASPWAPTTLPAGSRVGAWTIVHEITAGGFGAVYEVRHADSREPAALKLLHARLAASKEIVARFEREIRVLEALRHPNVVRLIDAGFHEGQPYLCTELLDGQDLARLLSRDGRVSATRAVEILEALCDALGEAHGRGIVHRDVKAANVMITSTGRVVLLDFGIAKISDALAPELTASNQSLGTPISMSPEQIQGGPVDARADIYGLGTLAFHLTTGQLPFVDSSAAMVQYMHVYAKRPRPSRIDGVSAELDEVIMRAMAVEPSERFPDVATMLAAARDAVLDRTNVRVQLDDDAIAILVTVTDRDTGTSLDHALLDDYEAVLPAAERFLAAAGFTLAADLGSSALFVAPARRIADPLTVADELWTELARRPTRDRRVAVRVCVHRDRATFLGDTAESSPLLQLSTWRLSDDIEGVWLTRAFVPDAPHGRRII